MDSIEREKRRAMAEFRRAESSRSALRALLSVLLLSFFLLVSLSSWDQLHLSLFLVDLPDCLWADRRAMFLLCNIILVVVAMDSGLLASFVPEMEPCDELPLSRDKGHRRAEERPSGVGSAAASADPAGSTLHVIAMDEGRVQEEEEEEEEGEGEGEEEEAEVEEDECPDMDELNKKFEDFIERVKRSREMEALQLVLV